MGSKLTKHYFPHDFNARNDDDIEAMLLDYKATGYGLYWGIVERLHEDENCVELNDRFYKAVAKQFMEDADKVKTFIHDCVAKYLLFELNDNILTCARVGRNIEKRSTISKERSDAGKAGAIAKKNKANASDKQASDKQTLANTSKEKKRKENEIYINHGSGKISVTINKVFVTDKIHRIFDLRAYFEHTKQLESITENGWVHFGEFVKANAGKVFNDADHLYNTFKRFCIEYKPPSKQPSKYEVAEERKRDWTLEAWEERYEKLLQTDNEFRKHFGYEELRSSTPVGLNGQRGKGP